MGRGPEERLSSKRDKNHILFGGTKILQHTPDKVVHNVIFNHALSFIIHFIYVFLTSFYSLLQTFHMKTPDGGCLAIVLRTGFETTQGKLMRTILFSTERVIS